MGPEVAGDEVVQAEPRWVTARWGLHTWVKVRGLWVCQQLICTSSVGKKGGRGSPAGPAAVTSGLDLRVGVEGMAVGGRQGQLVGAPGPRKQATLGTRLQAASAGSQRHNGLLVRLGGSGGGEAGRGGGEAGQERA